jgi:hypothetical protein
MRPTTIRDARRLKLLPSVTTILKVLHKPALESWKIEQAVLSVLTAERKPDEQIDAFAERVLRTERQQDAEAATAAEKGKAIHGALELAVTGKPWDEKWSEYVLPALEAIRPFGKMIASEKVIVGKGYAGKTDYVAGYDASGGPVVTVADFKCSKSIPEKEAWDEHQLQLAAYAAGLDIEAQVVHSVNVYISTREPGMVKVHTNLNWKDAFERGFMPILSYWQWRNDYNPYV